MEDTVQDLEKKWSQVQANVLKQPTPSIVFHLLCGMECRLQVFCVL